VIYVKVRLMNSSFFVRLTNTIDVIGEVNGYKKNWILISKKGM
jgi:hypothetical protein